jgi:hypothetical protein
LDAFGPADTPARLEWWSHTYISDGNGHPSILGHAVIGQLVAHLLASHVLSALYAPAYGPFAAEPRSAGMPPVYVSAAELGLYLEGQPAFVNAVHDAPLRADGWVQVEEPGRPGRGGLVAEHVGATVTFALRHGRSSLLGRLHVVLFKSYENVGRVSVLLSTAVDEGACLVQPPPPVDVLAEKELDCLWQTDRLLRVSEPSVVRIEFDAAAATSDVFCVRLRVVAAPPPRSITKVKLVSLSLF